VIDRPELRTLGIGGPGQMSRAEWRRLVAEDAMPDGLVADAAIGAVYVDERYLDALPRPQRAVLRRLPFLAAQAVVARRDGRRFDALLSWSDLRAVVVGSLARVWPRRPAHVAILMWPSAPKKAPLLRFALGGIDRLVVPPPLQRAFVAERLGVAADRFVDARWPVDTRFWRPMERPPGELICSAGQEMRDYGTLIEALRGLDVPCHIAAGTGGFGTSDAGWWCDVAGRPLPPRVTIGPKSYVELRDLYARARFVVVPLVPSDSDNGITTILEAFAMGKAVICTDTPGQSGVLEAGVNCLRVPPHDPGALRDAIRTLWDDPETCRRMGAAGRRLVVERHGLDQWTAALHGAVAEAVALRAPRRALVTDRERSPRRATVRAR
jgi:glycosyltransferase involved in cell wall biosynthesis